MSDDKRQQFQERVARLEAKKQAEAQAYQEQNPTVSRERRSQTPLLIALSGASVVALSIALAFPYISASFDEYAGSSRLAGLRGAPPIAAIADREEARSIYPIEESTVLDFGRRLGNTRVAAAHGSDILLETLIPISDVGLDDGTNVTVSQYNRSKDCSVRPVRSGEVLYSVNVEAPSAFAPLQVFSETEIANHFIATMQGDENPDSTFRAKTSRPGLINVFVADTSGPLYLVLQSMSGAVWNLSVSEGVEIAHVTMIGETGIGVSNLPMGTTINSLKISDFVPSHSVGTADGEARPCMIRPWRKPRPDWPAYQSAEHDIIQNYQTGHAAFDVWFTSTFGVGAEINERSVYSAQHVLVGSAREAATYAPVKGSHIWIDSYDFVFAGDDSARDADFRDALANRLEKIAEEIPF